VDPTDLNFGNVSVGQTRELTLTVKNTGGDTLNVSPIGSDNPRFSTVPPNFSFSVLAGGQQTVTVRFAPAFAGAQTGTLTINSNDPDEPTRTVRVQGVASVPAPDIGVAPQLLDFGTVVLGQERTGEVTVSNAGNAPLSVLSITSSNSGRFIVESPTAFTVAAGALSTVTVRFKPGIGLNTATLTINSNDPDEPSRSITMQGRGTLGPPPS
jgi:hypothetical protein